MARELQRWIANHTFVDTEAPDPYLLALMNVALLPPTEFETASGANGTTDQADGFVKRRLDQYMWLARLWLKNNEDNRPDWIVIHD